MNQILTDEEITLIVRECARGSSINRDGSTSHRIARAIEAAVINKLNSAEPVAKIDYRAPYGIAFTLEGSKIKDGTKLFTHPPAPSVPEWQPIETVLKAEPRSERAKQLEDSITAFFDSEIPKGNALAQEMCMIGRKYRSQQDRIDKLEAALINEKAMLSAAKKQIKAEIVLLKERLKELR